MRHRGGTGCDKRTLQRLRTLWQTGNVLAKWAFCTIFQHDGVGEKMCMHPMLPVPSAIPNRKMKAGDAGL
jgi:hypothetical protein